jgi:HSP20 family protein
MGGERRTTLTTSAGSPNASIWIAFMAALSTDIDTSLARAEGGQDFPASVRDPPRRLLTPPIGVQEKCAAGAKGTSVQQKRELEKKEETTIPARVFLPTADIYETEDALKVVLEMPGLEKNNVDASGENGVLKVEGRLDSAKYQGPQPLYTEYNVGHYSRTFRLSSKIDHNGIGAELRDGVLILTLPKVEEAKPITIQVK